VQRAGPSTGLPTLVGQADMMQARWGSHGDYRLITVSPSSPQEAFDLTIRAFDLSERFRVPVMVMTDGAVGHMYEKVSIPPAREIVTVPRRRPTVPPADYIPYRPDADMVPPMAEAGHGYRFHVTGLTHDERGYPAMTPEAQDVLIRRLIGKIDDYRDEIIEIEEDGVDEAEVVVLAYGITARVATIAVQRARDEGMRVGLLRLITVWPFPDDHIAELAAEIKGFVVPEINYGQVALEVERCAGGRARTLTVPHMGGAVHNPSVILDAIRRVAE
jgi:2-oxoglutarate ferredoxin oxidoreductase subunit alpha